MENNNTFTKNYRDSMSMMMPRRGPNELDEKRRRLEAQRLQDMADRMRVRHPRLDFLKHIEMPEQMAENDGGDPNAVYNMQVMDNIQNLGNNIRNTLLDIFGGTIGIGRRNDSSSTSTAPDEIYIDVDGVINNLRRISGGNWDKNYRPRSNGWIKLPYPSGSTPTEEKMPNYSGGESTYEEMFVPKAPAFKYNTKIGNGGR